MNALTASQGVAIVSSVLELFGVRSASCTHEIHHVQDPALVELLGTMAAMRSEFLIDFNVLDPLRAEIDDTRAELHERRERQDRAKTEAREAFGVIIETAKVIVLQATEPVDVLLGTQGSGKSTVANLLYGLKEAVPGQGFSHVTTQNKVHCRGNGHRPLVDTVGSMPGAKGIMRVLACIICGGMSPEGLIVVHNERVGSLRNRLALLGANVVNSISFDARSFWRDRERDSAETEADEVLFQRHMFVDPAGELSGIHQIADASSPIQNSDLRARLVRAFTSLDYDTFENAVGGQRAVVGTIFYLAKTLTERHNYGGSDLAFIDRIV